MRPLTLTMLGGFEARLGSGRLLRIPSRKTQALLAYLALHRSHAVSRNKLAGLLWGGAGEARARHSLRQALFALRKIKGAVGPRGLAITKDAIGLGPTVVDLDVSRFETLVRAGTLGALARASSLYGGDFLDGFHAGEAPFEEWVLGERERLRAMAISAMQRLLTLQTGGTDAEAAVATAVRLLAIDPLSEPVHRTLMQLYARLGRLGMVVQQYRACAEILARDLDIEPDKETQALYRALRKNRAWVASTATTPHSRHSAGPRDAVDGCSLEMSDAPSLFVGRRMELASLKERWAEARRGRGRVAVVFGAAGVGKSRLVAELLRNVSRRRARVLVGKCFESEQVLPFGPWIHGLRAGGVASAPEFLQGFPVSWKTELGRVLPELAEAAPPFPSEQAAPARLFEAITQLIRHLAEPRPLVMVIEDLHWADEMSLRLFSYLARRIERWPVLIIGTVREDEMPLGAANRRFVDDLVCSSASVRCDLGPLSPTDMATLVRAMAPRNVAPDALESQVWAASRGNPFMAVEALRALSEGSAWEPDGRLPLPDRVRHVIEGRLDRLSEPARTLAAVAAVIGREFEFSLLRHAVELEDVEIADGVDELVNRGILREVGEAFDFAHDQIRDVVTEGLRAPRRAYLHARVLVALEASSKPGLGPRPAALALHAREAGAWEKAVAYFHAAGRESERSLADREATILYEASLAALGHLPETRELQSRALDVLLDLRNARIRLAEFGRALEDSARAEVLAQELGDRTRSGIAAANLSYCLSRLGDQPRAVEAAERALVIARELGDAALAMAASSVLGQAYYALGNYRQALECFRPHIERGDDPVGDGVRLPLGMTLVGARIWSAWCLIEIGEFSEAERLVREAVGLARAAADAASVMWASYAVGPVYVAKGDPTSAIPILERSLAECRSGRFRVLLPWIMTELAQAYVLAGRVEEAVLLSEEAIAEGDSTGQVFGHVGRLRRLAEAYARTGRASEAGVLAALALDLSRRVESRSAEAYALRTRAEVILREDPHNAAHAETCYRDALVLAAELEMRPLEAFCHLDLGALLRLLGRQTEAAPHLRRASALFTAMDMPLWCNGVVATA